MKNLLKTIQVCLLAILLALPAAAQQSAAGTQIDSILVILPQLRDTEKLQAIRGLISLAFEMPVRQHYVNMLLDEARRQKNVNEEGRAFAMLTEIYFSQTDNDSIFIYGEEAIRFTRQHKLYNFLFTVHQTVIMRHLAHGKLQTAIRKAEEVYEEAKELQEFMPMARILALMGNIYDEMGQLEEAFRYYGESVEIAKQNIQPNSWIYIENYNSLATIANRLERYDLQMQYADSLVMELERFAENNPTNNLQTYYFIEQYHRTVAHAKQNNPEQAFQAIQNALSLFDPHWKGTFYEILLDEMYSVYFFLIGNYQKADEHINNALRFYEDNQLEDAIIQKKMNKAELFFEMGDPQKAAEIYLEIIRKNKEINQKRFYAQINELRTLYELDKAELEAVKRLAAIKLQRIIITGLILACFAMVIISALTLRNRRKIAKKNLGLFRQIKEQDHLLEKHSLLEKELNILKQRYETQIESTETDESNQQKALVLRLQEYLNENKMTANLKTDANDLAIQLNTNRRYLFEAIKTITGKTLNEYINITRIENAKQLIETSAKSIEELVEILGFSERTFYRIFKNKYNISPSEYRKLSNKYRVNGEGYMVQGERYMVQGERYMV